MKKTVPQLRPEWRLPFENAVAALTQIMTETVEVDMTFRETVQTYLNEWIYTAFYFLVFWPSLFIASIVTGIVYGVKDAVNYAKNQRFG
jgi:hypothetical protein